MAGLLKPTESEADGEIDGVPSAANNPFDHFPSEVADFDSDPRISYSRTDAKWLLETESGAEFEYIEEMKRWVPTVRRPPTGMPSPAQNPDDRPALVCLRRQDDLTKSLDRLPCITDGPIVG